MDTNLEAWVDERVDWLQHWATASSGLPGAWRAIRRADAKALGLIVRDMAKDTLAACRGETEWGSFSDAWNMK